MPNMLRRLTTSIVPAIVPPFLAAYPDIRLEVIAEESFVDVIAAGYDAGIRYEERLERDMIAVPIGPRVQRFALGAAPAYLDRRGKPEYPRDLLKHSCLQGRFPSGVVMNWEFERDGEVVRIDPSGPLLVSLGGATDLLVDAAIAGSGIVPGFEDWLRPYFDRGVLEPVLESWWQRFSGPFFTTRGDDSCQRPCGRSSISSRRARPSTPPPIPWRRTNWLRSPSWR
jgi:DNA-binding transcriptional LysR family regulator